MFKIKGITQVIPFCVLTKYNINGNIFRKGCVNMAKDVVDIAYSNQVTTLDLYKLFKQDKVTYFEFLKLAEMTIGFNKRKLSNLINYCEKETQQSKVYQLDDQDRIYLLLNNTAPKFSYYEIIAFISEGISEFVLLGESSYSFHFNNFKHLGYIDFMRLMDYLETLPVKIYIKLERLSDTIYLHEMLGNTDIKQLNNIKLGYKNTMKKYLRTCLPNTDGKLVVCNSKKKYETDLLNSYSSTFFYAQLLTSKNIKQELTQLIYLPPTKFPNHYNSVVKGNLKQYGYHKGDNLVSRENGTFKLNKLVAKAWIEFVIDQLFNQIDYRLQETILSYLQGIEHENKDIVIQCLIKNNLIRRSI